MERIVAKGRSIRKDGAALPLWASEILVLITLEKEDLVLVADLANYWRSRQFLFLLIFKVPVGAAVLPQAIVLYELEVQFALLPQAIIVLMGPQVVFLALKDWVHFWILVVSSLVIVGLYRHLFLLLNLLFWTWLTLTIIILTWHQPRILHIVTLFFFCLAWRSRATRNLFFRSTVGFHDN